MVISAIEVRTASSGHLPPTHIQIHTSCTSTPLASTLRMATISPTASRSAASPSRALRSLPLSVMMSGSYNWYNGNSDWGAKNGYGSFWASTPNSCTLSRHLFFYSTNVNPKYGNNKPNGFSLRCVARLKPRTMLQLNICKIKSTSMNGTR